MNDATDRSHGTVSPWIQTYCGDAFPLLAPQACHVRFRDIAEALAKINRFTGHTLWPYSVAQHSLLVADIAVDLGLGFAQDYALLHDAHEAYVGDIATPLKRALQALGAPDMLDKLVDPIDRAIHEAFGLAWPPMPEIAAAVKRCDLIALATERRDLLNDGPDWRVAMPDPSHRSLRRETWTWSTAAERFHARAHKMGLVR